MIPVTTEQWIALYVSDNQSDKIKSGRLVSELTHDQIVEIKKILDHKKIPIKGKLLLMLKNPNEPKTSNQHKVFWGEDEWEWLVPKVASLHLKEPTTGITNIATRLMSQMPAEKRRSVHAGLVSELSKRLVEYNRKWLNLDHELVVANEEIKRRKEAVSREEVIASLTDEEIQGFTDRIIDNLSPIDLCSRFSEQVILDCISTEAVVAQAVIKSFSNFSQHSRVLEENLTMLSRLLAEMPQEKIRKQLEEKSAPARLPQVAFVGFKAEQIAIVADSLHGRIRLDIIDKNRSRFDSQADIILMWKKFISHSFEAQIVANMKKGARLIRFGGGLESAAREVERAIALL
jgi:hypothetical protein